MEKQESQWTVEAMVKESLAKYLFLDISMFSFILMVKLIFMHASFIFYIDGVTWGPGRLEASCILRFLLKNEICIYIYIYISHGTQTIKDNIFLRIYVTQPIEKHFSHTLYQNNFSSKNQKLLYKIIIKHT